MIPTRCARGWNPEPGGWNLEPRGWNLEPGGWNPEPGATGIGQIFEGVFSVAILAQAILTA